MTEETKSQDIEVATAEDVNLEIVEKTIDEVVAHNEAVTAENESLKKEASMASDELAAIKADLEEVYSKPSSRKALTVYVAKLLTFRFLQTLKVDTLCQKSSARKSSAFSTKYRLCVRYVLSPRPLLQM